MSEHHWFDKIILKDLMFDNFKAKSWSDEKDRIDLECAKENHELECREGCYSFADEDDAIETAVGFAEVWIESYYTDCGFDNGLLTFKVKEWGDDGPDTRYYEIEFYRDDKPCQTLYVAVFKRADGEWGIFKAIVRGG